MSDPSSDAAPAPGAEGGAPAVEPGPGSSPPAGPAEALARRDVPFRSEDTAIRPASPAAIPWMAASKQFESFRELRTRLLDKGGGAGLGHFTTMVVPMTDSCGGSFVARNLAAAFTLQQRPSLLIECNFRIENDDDGFGPGRNADGLFSFLSDVDNPSSVLPIWPTAIRGLNVIPAGRRDPALAVLQSEQLSSGPMRDLMEKVRGWPCYGFLDAPPIEGSPDARILSEFADFVVLVVGYGRVTPRAIAQAAAMFDRSKLVGAVFNEATAPNQRRAG